MSSSAQGNIKCFVCEKEKDPYICADCICSGEFVSSKNNSGLPQDINSANVQGATQSPSTSSIMDTFAEKKLQFNKLEDEFRRINDRFEILMADSKQSEALKHAINEHGLRISAIEKIIGLNQWEVDKADEYSKRLNRTLELLQGDRIRFLNDLDIIKKAVAAAKSRLKASDTEFEKIRNETKEATEKAMKQLKEYIFPFYCENSNFNSTATNSVEDNYFIKDKESAYYISEDDSFSTTCCPPSMGSWANVESNCDRYHIVESWISKDSVSQSYINWLHHIQETCKLSPIGEPDSQDGSIRDNDAYRVSAALSYITQLLSVASYYIDAHFLKKLNFVEFYSKFNDSGTELYLTEEEILHKVAKLNANLVYLCLSQKVEPHLLEPGCTGQNLLLLFNPKHSAMTRAGSIYMDSETYRRVEESLYPDYILVDPVDNQDFPETSEFCDESEYIENDWEAVTAANTIPYADLYGSQQTTASMSGGIMSSIVETALYAATSFFRKK